MFAAASASPTVTPHAGTFTLPRAWVGLLAIADFDEAFPMGTPKCRGGIAVDDPRPYRDDFREMFQSMGAFDVVARLISGGGNYYLSWEVIAAGTVVRLYTDDDGTVDFAIYPEQEMTLANGSVMSFTVALSDGPFPTSDT
jgi:hypothetical protein